MTKKYLYTSTLILFLLSQNLFSQNVLTKDEQAAGWKLLFNGKNLEGWRIFQNKKDNGAWKIKDGALALVSTKGQGFDLISNDQYENFELSIEYKISKGGNSGIFFHVLEDTFTMPWQTGREVQILDNDNNPESKNITHAAGANYDLIGVKAGNLKKAGEYNKLVLKVNNGHVEHWLNGEKALQYELWTHEWNVMVNESKFSKYPAYGLARKGFISLQDHGDKVWFRNIKIRSLDNRLTDEEMTQGWKLLFNGENTDGWRNFKKNDIASVWKASDGALVLTGKNGGDIITNDQYENFELSLDWKISENGNSGIFFNVLEGDFDYVWRTGPEVQILDDLRHSDNKLLSHRAGANYDLHAPNWPAVKNAGEYNHTVIKVNKGHIEQWLNGFKVVEYDLWTDEWRKRVKASKFAGMPDYGLSKSGHIALQDHGDMVSFRNIKIKRL